MRQSGPCRLACPVWHRTLAPWPSAIGHKAQTCQLALHRQMRDRHTNESHMEMEGHHWQAHRLSPTYAAASTMTGDMSITHHVGPRPQQGWPVSRPPLPVPLQSRGGGMSATLLDIPECMPCLTCVQHQPPHSPLFAHPTVITHGNRLCVCIWPVWSGISQRVRIGKLMR